MTFVHKLITDRKFITPFMLSLWHHCQQAHVKPSAGGLK